MKIVAYASTTRQNHLWSVAQFNSALPKNRSECDIPLVAKTEAEVVIERLRDVLQSIITDCQGASVCGQAENGLEAIFYKASEALSEVAHV